MFYITGDTHGEFGRMRPFFDVVNPSKDDVMIILGDVGLNYYKGNKDNVSKYRLTTKYPMTYFCIFGNHEYRPEQVGGYEEKEFYGGKVWYETKYPEILFAQDGEVYHFPSTDGTVKDCIVIGGAYSVDKFYRLKMGYMWNEEEQPSEEIKVKVEKRLSERNNKIDVILSHTSPFKYEPREVFLPMIDQSAVDESTEKWLDTIEENNDYKKWYCGHFHTEKKIDRLQFMFKDIEEF